MEEDIARHQENRMRGVEEHGNLGAFDAREIEREALGNLDTPVKNSAMIV